MSHQQLLLMIPGIYQRISLSVSQSENVRDIRCSKIVLTSLFEGKYDTINIKFRTIQIHTHTFENEKRANLNFSSIDKGNQRDSAFFPAAFSF